MTSQVEVPVMNIEQAGQLDSAVCVNTEKHGSIDSPSQEKIDTRTEQPESTASDHTEHVKESDRVTATDAVQDATASLAKAAISEKKVVKENSKSRRKEDKGIGKEELKHVLKALSSLETTEEKLAALCKKYTELLDEHRLLQNGFKQTQKKHNTLSREKDQLQNEQSKTVLAKSKLESLCRELQKHNKIIKDESVARAKEEDEKRKEVTAKFQATINDIQRQMNENYEKNNKLRDENVELANKLKNLIEQYELREQHIEKLFKHKELELQLVDAKLAQSNLMMTEEKERNIKEKQLMLDDACHARQKIELFEGQEKQLRGQVALYTEKYEEFQTTLAKSNEVFQSFKSEMDKMTKKIKKLEKETTMWRSRWENSNRALLEMAEQKTRTDKETALLNNKVHKLESLCRALQEERKKLAAKVADVDTATINGVVHSEKTLAEPTTTPPNTPEGSGSRASPVTVVHDEEAKCAAPNDHVVQDAKQDDPAEPTAPEGEQAEQVDQENSELVQSSSGKTESEPCEDLSNSGADSGDK